MLVAEAQGVWKMTAGHEDEEQWDRVSHDTLASPAEEEGRWRICKGSCDLHMTCWVQKNVQRDKEGKGKALRAAPLVQEMGESL